MVLFRNLRIRAGRLFLSGRTSKIRRKPLYNSFNDIKSIGVVWDASKPDDFRLLSHFHQKMSEKGIDVMIFGFFPGKELPDQYTAIRYFRCLRDKETDLFYRPVADDAISFINRPFDVLIDLNFRNQFPLYYITTLSHAGLKVGLADLSPESSPFDLIISMKNPVTVDGYLDQVLYYLKMIHSEPEKRAV